MQPNTARSESQYRGLIPFKPGQSGNPKGRKKGTRDALSQNFIEDLHAMWKEAGPRILIAAAMKNPADIVKAVAALVPKDFQVTVQAGSGFRELWSALATGQIPKVETVDEDE